MKKIYLSLILVSLTMLIMAQVPTAWGSLINEDYATSKPDRDTVKIKAVADDFIDDFATLTELMASFESMFVVPADLNTSQTAWNHPDPNKPFPDQDPADFTGEFALMASPTNLYVLMNVVDEKIDDRDGCEIVIAPYAEAFVTADKIEIDTTIAAGYDASDSTYNPNAWTKRKVDWVHESARYGLWTNVGATKLAGIAVATNADLFAGTLAYDISESTTTVGNYMPSIAAPTYPPATVKTPTVTETNTAGDGYLLLVTIPWELMNDNKLVDNGDKMSFALQIRDGAFQADGSLPANDSVYTMWGGAIANNAFTLPAYYGAVAVLVKENVDVTGVALDQTSINIVNGETSQLTAVVNPADATDKTVVWTSDDDAIATVDAAGLVTAVAIGSTTITVTTNDGNFTDDCAVTVVATAVAVTGVSLDETTLSIESGSTGQLTATVNPSEATDKAVVWTTSDDAIATVDAVGLVTAVAKGSATITVTTNDGDFTADCAVTVTTTSGISNTSLFDVNIYVSNNELVIPANELSLVNVYNITGSLIMSVKNPSGNINIDNLNRGIYVARVLSLDGKVASVKFIK